MGWQSNSCSQTVGWILIENPWPAKLAEKMDSPENGFGRKMDLVEKLDLAVKWI